jgi:hypothetical protein
MKFEPSWERIEEKIKKKYDVTFSLDINKKGEKIICIKSKKTKLTAEINYNEIKNLFDTNEYKIFSKLAYERTDRIARLIDFDKEWLLNNVYVVARNLNGSVAILSDVVFEQFLDLAMIYAVSINYKDDSILMYLSQNMIDNLGVTVKELKNSATKNMKNDLVTMSLPGDFLIAVTNRDRNQGAGMFFVLNETAKALHTVYDDVYVLPSSIHEVLIFGSDGEHSVNMMKELVESVNQTTVSPEEYLSDNVYKYDHENDCFLVAR